MLLTELGEIVDWVENTLKVPRERGERVSEYVKRAVRSRATARTDGGEMNVLVVPEKGAAVLLGNRQKKSGNGTFGNVTSEASDTQNHYSVKRDGKTDRFSVLRDKREFNRLNQRKTQLAARLGEVASQRESAVKKAGDLKSSLALNREAFARKFEKDRNLGEEQAVIDQFESQVRLLEDQVPGFDAEIKRLKEMIAESEAATRGKYTTVHEIPAGVELEVELRWPVQG